MIVAVSFIRRKFRVRCRYSRLAIAAVLCLRLIVRARRTATTLLNYLRFKGASDMAKKKCQIGFVYLLRLESVPRLQGGESGRPDRPGALYHDLGAKRSPPQSFWYYNGSLLRSSQYLLIIQTRFIILIERSVLNDPKCKTQIFPS